MKKLTVVGIGPGNYDGLTVGAVKALEAAGLSAVRDIAAMSESDLLQIRNIGAAASKTILNALKAWQG